MLASMLSGTELVSVLPAGTSMPENMLAPAFPAPHICNGTYIRWTTELYTQWSNNYWSVNQKRILQHEIDKLCICESTTIKFQFFVRFNIFTQQISYCNLHFCNEFYQNISVWWCIQIMDNIRFNTATSDHSKCIPGCSAIRIMINRYIAHAVTIN